MQRVRSVGLIFVVGFRAMPWPFRNWGLSEKVAIAGVFIGLLGVIVALLAIPPGNLQEARHWVWRVTHKSKVFLNPSRENLGFDRCAIIENLHHCGNSTTKRAADAVCEYLGFTEALSYTWSIHPVNADWIWEGYDDLQNHDNKFRKIDTDTYLVASPEEPNPGQEYRIKIIGTFDTIECE